MTHINIEIKARLKGYGRIRDVLKSEHASFKGKDHQVDTYFKVPSGRLKLREGTIENFLVYYNREDKAGPKQSSVILYPTRRNTSALKDILTKSLGIFAVIDKQREIYFIKNVKFHLDAVKNLGTFVEIEAQDKNRSLGKARLLQQCQHYLDLFAIKKKDLISNSYSDLLLKRL